MTRRIAFAALFTALAAHAALTMLHLPRAAGWVYLAIQIGAAGLVVTRAATVREVRGGWSLAAAMLTLGVVADVARVAGLARLVDGLFLAMFLCSYAALSLLVRDRIRPFPAWLTIDGVLAGLTLAALASAAFTPIRELTGGDPATVASTLVSFGCDLLLLVVIIVAFGATSWRPGRVWTLLGLGMSSATLGDGIFVFLQSAGRFEEGSLLENLWAVSVVCAALAAWQPPAAPTRAQATWAMASIPLGGSAISISTLLYGGLTGSSPVTLILAAAALFAGLARAAVMLAENFKLLRRARQQAITDKLTELPNRRALGYDLDKACVSGDPHTLLFFDLDGFKDYNDAFGHPAGDALLQRLAPALAGVGRAYRLGGDEFCLLLEGAVGDDDPVVARAVDALSEEGEGFSIGASYGLVAIPHDAADPTTALRLADDRMYARKRRRRGQTAFTATLTQLCQGSATLAASGRADHQRSG